MWRMGNKFRSAETKKHAITAFLIGLFPAMLLITVACLVTSIGRLDGSLSASDLRKMIDQMGGRFLVFEAGLVLAGLIYASLHFRLVSRLTPRGNRIFVKILTYAFPTYLAPVVFGILVGGFWMIGTPIPWTEYLAAFGELALAMLLANAIFLPLWIAIEVWGRYSRNETDTE